MSATENFNMDLLKIEKKSKVPKKSTRSKTSKKLENLIDETGITLNNISKCLGACDSGKDMKVCLTRKFGNILKLSNKVLKEKGTKGIYPKTYARIDEKLNLFKDDEKRSIGSVQVGGKIDTKYWERMKSTHNEFLKNANVAYSFLKKLGNNSIEYSK